MQSLADLLQFLLRQPDQVRSPLDSSATAPSAYGPDSYPLNAGLFTPSDTSAQLARNAGNRQEAFGASDIPDVQLGMPTFRSSQWDVTFQGSSGGILGNHPIVPGNSVDASRPAGILYTFDDPERSPVDGLGGQLLNPLSLDPFGASGSPMTALGLGGLLNSARTSTMVPQLQDLVPPSPSRGQLAAGQTPKDIRSGADIEYPQGPGQGVRGTSQAQDLSSPGRSEPSPDAAPPPEFSSVQTRRGYGINARVHYPGALASPTFGSDNSPIAFRASSENEETDDWSKYIRLAQDIIDVDPSAITGDPRIDSTTSILLDALVKTVREMELEQGRKVSPRVFGTLAHSRFARRVEGLNLPGIGPNDIEQSWSLGDLVRYGFSGSKRTDIFKKDNLGRPLVIYDLKTGDAQLTADRADELRRAVGAPDIPIIELNWRDLMALRRQR